MRRFAQLRRRDHRPTLEERIDTNSAAGELVFHGRSMIYFSGIRL